MRWYGMEVGGDTDDPAGVLAAWLRCEDRLRLVDSAVDRAAGRVQAGGQPGDVLSGLLAALAEALT